MYKSLFILFISFLLISCNQSNNKNNENILSISILPEKYFVEQIAGDDFKINVAIVKGSSHSDYEPSPSELTTIHQSVAYFKMGQIGFEYTVLPKILSSSHLKVYDLSEGVQFKENIDGHSCDIHGIDPHIWLSPKKVKIIATNICKAVSELKPEQTDKYQKNLQNFHQRLDSLDSVISLQLAPLKNRSFMIYHPALTYFADDYNMKQVSIEMEGKEPTVAWMNEVTSLVYKDNIKIIFIQSQYDTNYARAISEANNTKLIVIDPLTDDWMNEMHRITQALVENGF